MSSSEDGFTLIEVLMAVTIMGIIGGAVTMAMIIGLRTTDATINRLTDSQDAQLAAAYFGTDVQEADAVGTGASCADPASSSVLDLVVGDPPTQSVVSYVVDADGDELRRVTCTVAAGGTTESSDVVVAASLASPPDVFLTCPEDVAPPCTEPTQVKMTVSVSGCSEVASSCREGVDTFPYKYDLLGTRRST